MEHVEHVRGRMWRRPPGESLEAFELLREGPGWRLQGTILALHEERAVEARYLVRCDAAWRTTGAEIGLRARGVERRLEITAAGGRWHAGDVELVGVRGCQDIDLSWSPSTNALPIRRLALAVGAASGPLTAAWVRFPDLVVEPLEQEYRRIGERRYHYSSGGGSFGAELEVDDQGLVIDYGELWRRVGHDD